MIFHQEPTWRWNKRSLRPEEEINSLRSARDARAPENFKGDNWRRNARGSAQSDIEVLGIDARSHHVRARERRRLIKFE